VKLEFFSRILSEVDGLVPTFAQALILKFAHEFSPLQAEKNRRSANR
jgi:hypothetical protein